MSISLFDEPAYPRVIIYTDGACKGNPGPGGWAALIMSGDGSSREISGSADNTTNNRMELKAVIEGLRSLKEPSSVTIVSDSAYVVNAFNQKWIGNWRKNGWRTKDRQHVKNRELWEDLHALCEVHRVQFEKVQGHSGHELNERVDQLANEAIV